MTAAPKHLAAEGKKFWTALHGEFAFDNEGELALVTAAAECLDRMAAARTAIAAHGEIVIDRYGAPKVNPACDLERQSKAQLLAALKQLGLNADDGAYTRTRERRHGPKKTAS